MSWVNIEIEKSYSKVSVALTILIFISAISVVYVVNKSRELFNTYYHLQISAQKYQDEYVRLLVQSGTENTTYNMLNSFPKTYLDMLVPKASNRLYLR